MLNSKKLRTLIIGLSLTVFSAIPVHAASYRVVSGDSLYSIGKTFNTSYTNLMQSNSLSNSDIYPGQFLNVPAQTYTVQSGDSLFLIAKKCGISLFTLRMANNQWTDAIYPGQKLLVPSAGTSTTTSSTVQKSTGVIPYTVSDVDLLARLIEAEAQGEPYNAKVAVGGVVVNRVQSSSFPNNIHDVIYQRISGYYQFTPVLNGWINKPASQDSINAAYAALHGSDPSNGALFYFDDSTTNTWLWSKPIAARIDRMVFVY